MSAKADFDLEQLEQYADLVEESENPGLVKEVVELFLSDTRSKIEAIRVALGRADAPGLEERAHSLKGSSSQLGAVRMAALAKKLEDVGRAAAPEGAGDLLARLEVEFARVEKFLGTQPWTRRPSSLRAS